MFTNTAEYALRAILHLATHREGRCGSSAIAKATKVPPGYLSKVLKDLVDAGLIDSQRGPNGGFTLAREPKTISVLEVIKAVGPFERIHTCPLGIASHGTKLCRLHRKLDDSLGLVESTLAAASIADMIDPADAPVPCGFPEQRAASLTTSARRRRA